MADPTKQSPELEQFLRVYGDDLQRCLELANEGRDSIRDNKDARTPTASEIEAIERVIGKLTCAFHPFDTSGDFLKILERSKSCRITRAYKDLNLVTSNLLNLISELKEAEGPDLSIFGNSVLRLAAGEEIRIRNERAATAFEHQLAMADIEFDVRRGRGGYHYTRKADGEAS